MAEDKTGEENLEKVRRKCLTRGFSSMKCFSSAFRKFDKDFNKKLNFQEFRDGLDEYEVDMDENQQRNLFSMLDSDQSGMIDFHEFYNKLSPPLQGRRLDAVEQVFKCLDKNADGVLQAEDIIDLFEDRAKNHPKFQSGEWTEKDVVNQLLTAFRQPSSREGEVTLHDFINYYSAVSACVQDDLYFETHLKDCWGIE